MAAGDRVSPFTPSRSLRVDELQIRAYERDDARELMEAVTESIAYVIPAAELFASKQKSLVSSCAPACFAEL